MPTYDPPNQGNVNFELESYEPLEQDAVDFDFQVANLFTGRVTINETTIYRIFLEIFRDQHRAGNSALQS